MDWYAHHIKRYRAKTMLLDPYQHGCYRLLIDEYMLNRHPLPDPTWIWHKIIGVSKEEWLSKAHDQIVPYFKRGKDGFWHQDTCDQVLRQQNGLSRGLSEAGKKGAEKRWKKHNENNGKNGHPIATPKPGHIASDGRGEERTEDKSPDSLLHTNARAEGETFTCDDALAAIGVQNDPNWHVRSFKVWNAWIAEGASPPLIMRAIEGVMAKRESPPGNMLYFRRAVEEAMAEEKSLKLKPQGVPPNAQYRSPRRKASDTRMASLAETRATLAGLGDSPGTADRGD